MLQQFILDNRSELIARCKEKAVKRFAGNGPPAAVDHGVPLLLNQIVDALPVARGKSSNGTKPDQPPRQSEVGRSAATHGVEMLRRGFQIDEVVREYGDVCQAVTQLAEELKFAIATEDFRIFNRCLDDAIADAVTAYGNFGDGLMQSESDGLHARAEKFSKEQNRLLGIAKNAFSAIRSGSVGATGATGNLLSHTLAELENHANRAVSEIVSGP